MPTYNIFSRWNSSHVVYKCEVTQEQLGRGIAARVAVESANLRYAYLSGANLSDAYLRGANLRDANLSDANLRDANLRGANLSDANLRYAYLSGANLSGANLSGANLSDANLSGANLNGANLRYANLSGANLIDANLRYANLRDANLSDANLSGANLIDANLSDANLSGAKWCGIIINRAPLHIGIPHQWTITILDDHMQIGCELHSLADWRTFDDARIVAMDGRNALRFWRTYKAALLAMAEADGRGVTKLEAA